MGQLYSTKRSKEFHSFIRSLLQVADRKSTLWAAPGLNRVVDQNDGTSRIEPVSAWSAKIETM